MGDNKYLKDARVDLRVNDSEAQKKQSTDQGVRSRIIELNEKYSAAAQTLALLEIADALHALTAVLEKKNA